MSGNTERKFLVRAYSTSDQLGLVTATAFLYGNGWILFPAHLLAVGDIPMFVHHETGREILVSPLALVNLPSALVFGDIAMTWCGRAPQLGVFAPPTTASEDCFQPTAEPVEYSTVYACLLDQDVHVDIVTTPNHIELSESEGYLEFVKEHVAARHAVLVRAAAAVFVPGSSGTPVFGTSNDKTHCLGPVVWSSCDAKTALVLDVRELQGVFQNTSQQLTSAAQCANILGAGFDDKVLAAFQKLAKELRDSRQLDVVVPFISPICLVPESIRAVVDKLLPDYKDRWMPLLEENAGFVRGVHLLSVALSLHDLPETTDREEIPSIFLRYQDQTSVEAMLYPYPEPSKGKPQSNWGAAIYFPRRRSSELSEEDAKHFARAQVAAATLAIQDDTDIKYIDVTTDPDYDKLVEKAKSGKKRDKVETQKYKVKKATRIGRLAQFYTRLSRHEFLSVHVHLSDTNSRTRLLDPFKLPAKSRILTHDYSIRHNYLDKTAMYYPGTSNSGFRVEPVGYISLVCRCRGNPNAACIHEEADPDNLGQHKDKGKSKRMLALDDPHSNFEKPDWKAEFAVVVNKDNADGRDALATLSQQLQWIHEERLSLLEGYARSFGRVVLQTSRRRRSTI